MKRALLIALTALLALTLGLAAGAGPAAAGGWAVTTLDPLPAAPSPGATMTIGWTIRQHGVTPVDLADFDAQGVETAILIATAEGSQRFVGRPDGTPGHYVADVTFPDTAGTYAWRVDQGVFGEQALGALTVAGAASAGAVGPSSPQPTEPTELEWPAVLRYGLIALTLASALWLAYSFAAERRRTAST